jgi:agmatine deiminase
MTPAEIGFFMPPEWAPHECCWMAWPCRPENWGDIEVARAVYARVARQIARFEPVKMIAPPALAADAWRQLAGSDEDRPPLDLVRDVELVGATLLPLPGVDIDLIPLPTNDSWTRDTAPTFLLDDGGRLAGVAWQFNAYGGIYADYAETAQMARHVLERVGVRYFKAPIVLEGGAVHTDGEGTLLTTEEVVLDTRRNPGLTKANAEEVFRDYLGVEKVIWLTGALDADNTGGHVDNLACFAAPGVVVALSETDPFDSQYAVLQENLGRLRASVDAHGRPLEVIELRQPAHRDHDGRRLSPSYVNFYLANGAVIVPGFGDPMDERARDTLAAVFPQREVVQVATLELAKSDGNIHCITQQQPAV